MKILVLPLSVCATIVAVSLIAPWTLTAQTISGQVTDSVTGTGVARGFVVLVNDRGQDVARTLAGEQGRFVISARAAGKYRVRSERIGYRVWESELIELRANQTVRLTLRVTAIPSRLAEIEVRGEETECRAAWDDVDTGTLWDEARKALAAASWAENEELYEYRLHSFAITQLRGRRPQVDVSASEATIMLPFRAETLDRLSEEGYVIDEGGTWRFYGPDANILLDTRFHETHCFGTRRGKGEFDGMLGLTFRPISSQRLPEIEGVLWIDAESSRLRQIEYRYQHLPFSVSRRGAGGSILFEPMDSGAWIINEWIIRMPLMARRPTISARGFQAPSTLRRGFRTPNTLRSGMAHEGAKVIEAFNLEGHREYVHPDAVHVRGHVFDSIQGGSLANDAVLVPGTGYEVITDSAGAFAFNTLLEGEYDVTSARLDSLGLAPSAQDLRFTPGDTVTVNLVVPSLATIYRKLCPRSRLPDNRFIVVGQVRDFEDEEPISGVRVAALWRSGDEVRAKTDESGRFVLCALPAGQQIQVVLVGRDYAAEPIGVFFADGLVIHETPVGRRLFVPKQARAAG